MDSGLAEPVPAALSQRKWPLRVESGPCTGTARAGSRLQSGERSNVRAWLTRGGGGGETGALSSSRLLAPQKHVVFQSLFNLFLISSIFVLLD